MTLRRAVAQERRVARSLKTVMEKRPCLPVTRKGDRSQPDITLIKYCCCVVQRAVVCSIRRASCAQTTTSSQLSRCSQCCNPTTLHVNPSAVRREIEATLQQMHVHACAVLNATASDDSLSFNFNVRLDTSTGPTTEISTTTPMNCAVDRAVKLLGARCHVQGHGRHGGDRPQFTVELGSPHQTVLLDGFGASEKTNDGNRQLILWVAISFDRCGALCL
ncbi:unnamed protein product [Phytophthora lilii]|uniref:Unnamed protein product n=1 Tax=Phytophthora lilii TaxID=2077276 RepID=A0A9W6UAQ5_9STRA|nr:unnamed protein product [Phytophthora lilii]